MLRLFLKIIFIYLFVAMPGLRCCMGFSLVAASGGYFLVVVRGLLTGVASPIENHRFEGMRASVFADPRPQSIGPTAVARGPIVPWQVGSSLVRDRTHVSRLGRRVLYC